MLFFGSLFNYGDAKQKILLVHRGKYAENFWRWSLQLLKYSLSVKIIFLG